ncbi:hypothetical protein DRO35_01190 [Candidatus Bathyarchaeota archaeon]|nr:MAG: hypothetical protein DRO35_01190 [Candidatus Bathyarchaeota archaeon]
MSGNYPHHMIKEIFEEPEVLRNTIRLERDRIRELSSKIISENYEMLYITGSGTSYHAGLAGQYALSNLVEIIALTLSASEFHQWIPQKIPRKTLLMAISQSGESSDVIKAVDAALQRHIELLAVTNTLDSTLAKKANFCIFPRSGRELAIPATKTYIAQLMAIYMFSINLALEKGKDHGLSEMEESLYKAPRIVKLALESLKSKVQETANKFKDKNAVFLLGSGPNYVTALEGALKLKETCKIFSEGFATREFLHGPMRLVDEKTIVVVMTSSDMIEDAVKLSRSFKSFGASVIIISEKSHRVEQLVSDVNEAFLLPEGMPQPFSPLLYILPLQLFAYYMSVSKGLNPDKPEKLVKVVR